MKFLAARWQDLLLANYRVDPEVLEPFVPHKTSIDAFQGNVYVSLVAFMFRSTRVLGIPVPWHRNFEEVNLRFYVVPDRDPSLRSVVFVREIVPKKIIPLIANSLFHENYVALAMDHGADANRFWYSWENEVSNRIGAQIDGNLSLPEEGSLAEFITEHYWGYAKGPRRTLEYRVEHPPWESCAVQDYQIDVDFRATYGSRFEFLNHREPDSVLYARGSDVTVSFPRTLV